MEGKYFLGKYLMWVILLFGQLHGYTSCIQKERNALFELKQHMISNSQLGDLDYNLPTWTNQTTSDCCRWEGLKCNRTSGRVTEIVLDNLFLEESFLLNISLLHPFEEVRSLKFSAYVVGLFDDVEELKDLTNLELLDLSRTVLMAPYQYKIISLRKLKALDLSSNGFSGPMELQGVCEMKNMQDLDLSRNKLVGQFPLCLTSLSGLRVLDLSSNQLTGNVPSALVVVGIDLSENELSGDIPVELGGLLELQGLNLSHNKLSGVIPESFSRLKNVESLDLSFNRLQGRIPPGLTNLSSLSVFNVSYNNVSGIIPQGKQFNTFDTQSYLGNPLLCGQQINRSCGSSNFQEPDSGEEDDESPIDMVSFYWSFAAAYVTILLGLFASLSFDSPWSRFWFYVVDVFIHKARKFVVVRLLVPNP
ncbi:unnamed protein product [Microthlaspi erraticum]|uniref:Leucine-rich repeat-containing N-terminal plant-type domain-containing protein n=1 Tax=Microthlaspi erraticum TaxID=1685480 RepID=A0A6D2KZM6_9BRAS|nr:unnamed protein product [Microthlaspi erraticum]